MTYSSLVDYHRQRAASAASSFKRRSQKWFYDEDATASASSKSWSDWADEDLLDADAYDGSGYSASSSLGKYWGGGSSYSTVSGASEKQTREQELARALKAVARSCNAIRATVGRGKDLSLKVKWGNGYESNNIKQNDVIVLSPDTILKKDVKQSWTEGKRSDALVGDALTAAAQKRTVSPSVVAEALRVSETDRDAASARVLWSAIETDAAQQALLNDYRGAAVYFAASNAFHSSDDYRTTVEQAFNDGKTRKSDAATVALAWNILHQKKLELPEDVKEATATAMREFASAKTCRDRWQASLRAVKFLRSLDPEQPEQEQEQEQPQPSPENPSADQQGEGGAEGDPQQTAPDGQNPANGPESEALPSAGGQIGIGGLLGDRVDSENFVDNTSPQDVEEIAEEDDDVNASNSYLEDEARHTRLVDNQKLEGVYAAIVEPATKALLAGYTGVVRRLSSLAELFSTVNTCESYGRRSGHLDESKLWSVPSGESNVFFRRDDSGEKREVSIAVLVDLSGSTHCRADTYGTEAWACVNPNTPFEERVQRAKKPRISTALKRAAVILSEALRASDTNSGVRVHTYGHYCGTVEYFGQTSNVVQGDNGGGTDESGALARTVTHLLESDTRECRKIVICIGDGETSAECLRRTVEASNRIGVEVYSVLIRNNAAKAKMHGEKVFGKGRFCALSVHDADKLPSVLTSFVTRVLSKAV